MTHISRMLSDSWPSFLDLLDTAPEEAFREFYSVTYRLLRVKPPPGMRAMTDMERQDLIHETVLHCEGDDFKVLRQYRNRGKPFVT